MKGLRKKRWNPVLKLTFRPYQAFILPRERDEKLNGMPLYFANLNKALLLRSPTFGWTDLHLSHGCQQRELLGEWLAGDEAVPSAIIRRQTHSGRPCGSAAFVSSLEERMNRALNPGKRGRKAAHHPLSSLSHFNSHSNL